MLDLSKLGLKKKKEAAPPPNPERERLSAAHDIDQTARAIYSREGPPPEERRAPLTRAQVAVPREWEDPFAGSETPVPPVGPAPAPAHDPSAMKKGGIRSVVRMFLVGAFLFFVVAAAFAAYVFYRQGNLVSSENVGIAVGAPLAVAGGEEVPIEVTIRNDNTADIESATLLVKFPEGTKNPSDRAADLTRIREDIGAVPAGGEVARTVTAVFFGSEKEVKRLVVEFDYRITGSSATFSKEKEVEIELSASPVVLTIDSLEEVSSNQTFELTATLTSNSPGVVDDMALAVEYPFGFTFVSSDPPAVGSTNNFWKVGDIAPGEKRTVRIRGNLSGQNEDLRAFRFSSGVISKDNPRVIGTQFVAVNRDVAIKKPFISLDIGFDGEASSEAYAFPGGRPVRVNVAWQNNLDTRVADVVIEVKVKGASLDRPTIRPEQGHYRSIDDIVLYDRATNPKFALLSPGDKGTASFSFSFLPTSQAADLFLQNQEVVFEASVRGRRMSGDTAIESLQNTVSKKVKVSSETLLSSRVSYSNSQITNWGPIPPRADQATRYTITWTVTNTFNEVSDIEVVAPTLPTYVRWTGVTYPPSENIKQLENGSIVWNVGTVKPYAGYVSSPREVQFQVEMIPSIIQIGSAPQLVRPAELTGTDRFTGTHLYATGASLNTVISTDPIYQKDYEYVLP